MVTTVEVDAVGTNRVTATVVRFRSREDKKPKHADELAWPQIVLAVVAT